MTYRLVASMPELAVTAVAGLSIGPMVLLLAGAFTPLAVWPAALAGAAVAVWVFGIPAEPGPTGEPLRRAALWSLAALAFVVVWFVLNAGFAAENVYATRDPATYNLAARWLMDNHSLHIYTHPEVFGSPPNSLSQSSGFETYKSGELFAQGNHLLPVLGALSGWAVGIHGLFGVNILLGAVALLALFALARRVVGSPLALLVTAIIAVSLPMVYVSRDMYSEPLMMLFLMGGLALLHRAKTSGRRRDYLLAGYVAGCAAMVRIDSYAALLAIVISSLFVMAIARRDERRTAISRGLSLLAGALVSGLVGWLDVTHLSSHYYHDERHHIAAELGAAVLLLVVGPALVRVIWTPRVRNWLAAERTRSRLTTAAVVILCAVFVVLLSRPLWYVGRYPRNVTLESWQAADHVRIDGTRSYNERTLLRIAAYVGWPTLLLAVAGYALMLAALLRRRAYPLVGVLTLGLTMSALYLWDAQITPDQPWVMRRFVPVVLPAMVIAFAYAVRWLWLRGAMQRVLAGALAVVAVWWPAHVTKPMWHLREEYPMYRQVQALCAAIGPHAAVASIDLDAYGAYGQTMRSYCHAQSLGLRDTSPAALIQARDAATAAGYRFVALARDVQLIPYAAGASRTPFALIRAELSPNNINHLPKHPNIQNIDIYLGTIDDQGRFVPLPPTTLQ